LQALKYFSQFFIIKLSSAAINPITALTRRQNGVVLSPSLKCTVEAVVAEALGLFLSVAEKTVADISSMLRDVLRGSRTEIEAIDAYIVRRAEGHGIESSCERGAAGNGECRWFKG
jgi:2-dehydropantoate 2-reductase